MSAQALSESHSQSLVEVLISLWGSFNRNYKRLFEYLWWMSKNLHFVFPSLETISENCKMAKRTVQNILKRFAEWGLIGWKKRGYRSNIYFMPEELINFDMQNKRFLTHKNAQNCHVSCHVLDVAKDNKIFNVHETTKSATISAPPDVPKDLEKEKQELRDHFKILPHALRVEFMKDFDFKNFGWIIKRLSALHIHEILRDMKWFVNQKSVQNKCALFVKLAIDKISKKKA